jgi:UDP-3-O-[3-hydroxymyristoyl] glucosamine N-acyltransferase
MTIRRFVKLIVFGLSLAIVSPLLLLAWLEDRTIGGEAVFSMLAQLLAIVPGPPGTYLRAAYYFATLEACSWETHVGFGSMFTHRGGSMGPRVSTGAYCVIGHACIEADVMIASHVSIPSGARQHLDESGDLTSASFYEVVTIGEKTWLGEGAIILASVGKSSIVAAGAVVTKELPDRSLIGGNPARVIRALG